MRRSLPPSKRGGGGVPVGMRLSQLAVNNFEHVWEGGADDAEALFSAMDANGADYLHINSVPAFKPVFGGDRTLAAHAREYFSGPVIACGGMSDAAAADGMIGAGDADFVAMARGALADPGWPNKIAAGDEPKTFDPGMTQPLATLDNTEPGGLKTLSPKQAGEEPAGAVTACIPRTALMVRNGRTQICPGFGLEAEYRAAKWICSVASDEIPRATNNKDPGRGRFTENQVASAPSRLRETGTNHRRFFKFRVLEAPGAREYRHQRILTDE